MFENMIHLKYEIRLRIIIEETLRIGYASVSMLPEIALHPSVRKKAECHYRKVMDFYRDSINRRNFYVVILNNTRRPDAAHNIDYIPATLKCILGLRIHHKDIDVSGIANQFFGIKAGI